MDEEYTCSGCGQDCSQNDDLYWCTNKKCYLFKNSNHIEKEVDRVEELEEQITSLQARNAKLEKAIKSTLDYIDGEHAGPCDSLGICSNCSIRFELDSVIEEAIKETEG